MTGEADLSIIIVNWNTKGDLLACLASVREKVTGITYEILVVDNGSVDGSEEAVRKECPGVVTIRNRRNLGFARAVNIGLGRAKGRFILLLNPDTLIGEKAVEKLVSFMESHPDAALAGGQLLNPDGSRQNSIASFPSLATELLNKSLLRWLFPGRFPGKERAVQEPMEVDSVIGACMIVRKEAISETGSLDETYFLFLEETDWCHGMKKAGWKVYHVPGAKIYHLQGRSAQADKKRARVEYYRSRYYFFRKNLGGLQWVLLHIGLMVRLTIELGLTSLACLLTLFMKKGWSERLLVFAYLFWWHLRLCPRNMGLEEKA